MIFNSVVGRAGLKADNYGNLTSDLACAATAFLVWDMLIHLDEEVEYIWRGPHSWVKWAYVFIRHVPYLVQCSILVGLVAMAAKGHVYEMVQCKAWIAYQLGANEVLTVVVEIILIVRIYAMYNRNWIVTTAVYVLFVAEIVAMCTILALTVPKFEFTRQCLITSTPNLFLSYWTISLAFETVLFLLTLYKFFSVLEITQFHRQPIMVTLVRDGTWAYAIIFAIMLLNTLMYELEKNTLAGICYFWELSVMSYAGSHVLLNLRRLAMDPRRHRSIVSFSTQFVSAGGTFSELHFGSAGEETTVIELETMHREHVD
ncbi:hypothetical protein L226DRAFT_237198 [Lentinus tigrinus ALCF2SS1-7]|uniref:DUF6533 domain-containing protein n=1 Tax=Lentinus tigrinus ALCF2SS1-6 TaxID=1328759 RepID=A0A5C2SQJ2_9APHY|nr:hypothetical protein L227DRAFT_649665 [Lentinus tigrinus ALCF2SS1-6]RPD78970.1 hypothetical protein L226DRAFT_237198 [Lentinus tigrinus ALCF2SS1-7]